MRLIGRVKFVQVQRSSLKLGEKPDRRYDPTPLSIVDSLELSPEGVVGLNADGGRLIDVHNARHPQTKFGNGTAPISIGFTAHYHAMRERFGAHLTDGIAGENILIEVERPVELDDLGKQIIILNPDTKAQGILDMWSVAAPCEPFSQFAAQERISGERLKTTLQFLHQGMRGFYLATAPGQPVFRVQAGDEVYGLINP
jgi:hypothetical protein